MIDHYACYHLFYIFTIHMKRIALISWSWLLPAALIGLKLYGIITWPWFWVLSPLWITIVLFLVGFMIYSVLVLRKGKKK